MKIKQNRARSWSQRLNWSSYINRKEMFEMCIINIYDNYFFWPGKFQSIQFKMKDLPKTGCRGGMVWRDTDRQTGGYTDKTLSIKHNIALSLSKGLVHLTINIGEKSSISSRFTLLLRLWITPLLQRKCSISQNQDWLPACTGQGETLNTVTPIYHITNLATEDYS